MTAEERAEEAAAFFDGSLIVSVCITTEAMTLTREDGKTYVAREARTGAGRRIAREAAETTTACLDCALPSIDDLIDLFLPPRTVTITRTKGGSHYVEIS